MKRLLFALTTSATLLLVGCGSEDAENEAPELNTSDIDKARAEFEQFEEKRTQDVEEDKIKEQEKTEKKDVRRSDAIAENSRINPPKLTDEEKKKGQEYNLKKEFKDFKDENNEDILKNYRYLGYNEDNYLSVGDKMYHRYITGKKDSDKANKEQYAKAEKFFNNAVGEVADLPIYDITGPLVGESAEKLESIANEKFNKESDYLRSVGSMANDYGKPEILGITRDYNDPGLYQIQFEYQDEKGTPMMNGISYYFVDALGKEQLQVQRVESTIFGAKAMSDYLDEKIEGKTN